MPPRAKPEHQCTHGQTGHSIQHVQTVHFSQDQIHHQNVRPQLLRHADSLLAVGGLADHRQVLLPLHGVPEDGRELLAAVGDQYSFPVFHRISPLRRPGSPDPLFPWLVSFSQPVNYNLP